MTLSRRQMIAGAAGLALMPARVWAQSNTGLPPGFTEIDAHPATHQIAPPGYDTTSIWGYDGLVPGPLIRVAQGGRVRRRLRNNLSQPTAIHWHGIRIDNAMDGVPGLTQDAVPPGQSFDYDFVSHDAGTYWYHSHNKSMEQVARGLYGPLIVDEPDPLDIDHDLVLVIDDWRLDPDTVQIAEPFDNFHDLSHQGRLGNLITVNGVFDPEQPVRQHDRLRLRLINSANARVFQVELQGMQGWVVALDGMPLEAPLPIAGAFTLAPAQRADLVVDITAEDGTSADLLSIEPNGGFGLMRFPVRGQSASVRRPAASALPPNPQPVMDNIAASPLHSMTMQGGAMSGLAPSRLGDEVLDARALAERGKFWALNGIVDRPDAPFIDAALGETLRISLINNTVFDHAMHLHGHHFRVIAPDGQLGPWRDTTLVPSGQTHQVALVMDNPGSWLLHCHMLEHAAAGMMSWVRVT